MGNTGEGNDDVELYESVLLASGARSWPRCGRCMTWMRQVPLQRTWPRRRRGNASPPSRSATCRWPTPKRKAVTASWRWAGCGAPRRLGTAGPSCCLSKSSSIGWWMRTPATTRTLRRRHTPGLRVIRLLANSTAPRRGRCRRRCWPVTCGSTRRVSEGCGRPTCCARRTAPPYSERLS